LTEAFNRETIKHQPQAHPTRVGLAPSGLRPGGLFFTFMEAPAPNTVRLGVLIDGFNFYHSIDDAIQADVATPDAKWFDYWALAESFLHQINVPGQKELTSVDYFSAYAHFRGPLHVKRHRALVDANKGRGVVAHMHRFKKRRRKCHDCRVTQTSHEEKETDVAMAIHLMRLFAEDKVDVAVLVTGDTDLLPAIKATFELWPHAMIWAGFPYKRKNKELAEALTGSFRIGPGAYPRLALRDTATRPSEWSSE